MSKPLNIEAAPLGDLGFAMIVEANRVEGDTMQVSKELWLKIANRIMDEVKQEV